MAIRDIITINQAGSAKSFVKESVLGDGNCFYRSLAKVLGRDERQIGWIRSQIADYIYNNWNFYKDRISDQDFTKNGFNLTKSVSELLLGTHAEQQYLREEFRKLVNTDGAWGDWYAITAATKIFNKNIVVIRNQQPVRQHALADFDATRDTIYLNHIPEYHYEPLITLEEKIAQVWWDNLYDSSLLRHKANTIFKDSYHIDIPDQDKISDTQSQDLWNVLIADLRAKSDEDLKRFYEEIIKLAKKSLISEAIDIDHQQKPDLFQSFGDAFASPEFSEKIVKLFGALFGVFRKIIIALNPGIELDAIEKDWPFQHKKSDKSFNFHKRLVEIFNDAGEPGRKLYRSLLTRLNQGEELTSEQMLYELLKEVRTSALFKKTGHEIMSKIEDLLYNDENKIEERVARQLEEAFSQFYNVPVEKLNDDPIKDDIYCKDIIDAIKQACAALAKKIKELKEKLTKKDNKDEELSESEKFTLWQILQTSRLKLSSCLLKIKAFSQGATVLVDGEFNNQFEKFFGKIAADLEEKAVAEATGPDVCVKASQGKSILKFFSCLDASKDILDEKKFNDGFNAALTKAKQSRKTEILDQIKLVQDRINHKLEQLTQFMRVAGVASTDTPAANDRCNNLRIELNKGLDDIKIKVVKDDGDITDKPINAATDINDFALSGYNKIKILVANYDTSVAKLEGYVDQIMVIPGVAPTAPVVPSPT